MVSGALYCIALLQIRKTSSCMQDQLSRDIHVYMCSKEYAYSVMHFASEKKKLNTKNYQCRIKEFDRTKDIVKGSHVVIKMEEEKIS